VLALEWAQSRRVTEIKFKSLKISYQKGHLSSVGSEKQCNYHENIGRINFTINMNAVHVVGGTTTSFIIIMAISPLKD